ncbi:MAG: hypothetical protein R3C28_27245 [Pirellulaceae bacterium]
MNRLWASALAIGGLSAVGLLAGRFSCLAFWSNELVGIASVGLLCGTIVLILVRFVLPGKVWLGYEWQLLAWPWLPVVGSLTTQVYYRHADQRGHTAPGPNHESERHHAFPGLEVFGATDRFAAKRSLWSTDEPSIGRS